MAICADPQVGGLVSQLPLVSGAAGAIYARRRGEDQRLGVPLQRLLELLGHPRGLLPATQLGAFRHHHAGEGVSGLPDDRHHLGRHLLGDHPPVLRQGSREDQHLRLLHRNRLAPSRGQAGGREDGRRDAGLLDAAAAHHPGLLRAVGPKLGQLAEPWALHGAGAPPLRQRLRQRRALHSLHLGHHHGEVRMDALLVEPRRGAPFVLLPVAFPVQAWLGPRLAATAIRLLPGDLRVPGGGLLLVGRGELPEVLLPRGHEGPADPKRSLPHLPAHRESEIHQV
mmetsp:Transcript_33277/g.79772  ORF Transcript_33277/g.79772 Transcript_33277/m.79772 type:complete len:282 (-) Transcript_33277:489-1334(-)